MLLETVLLIQLIEAAKGVCGGHLEQPKVHANPLGNNPNKLHGSLVDTHESIFALLR
jgi:hypothetical protein